MKTWLQAVIGLLLPLAAAAVEIPVADAAALERALQEVRPGDVILLAEGEWRDVVIRCQAEGTGQAPITLRAAVPGKTVFTGASGLRLGGRHVRVEGLWFRNPDPAVGDTMEFRLDSKRFAEHCRVSQCAVTLDPGQAARDAGESRWLGLYGSDNRVDRCYFAGKVTKGATAVVWLGEGQRGGHRLDHNHFGPRERLGENGGETIRVGDSKTSMTEAACLIEDNLFERCNGEAECLSNKSCGNVYRRNVFLEVSGALTLRHGNGCLVEQNVFLGNDAAGTGGIRIIGEDHVVRGNHLQGLAGDDARSGLTLMLGVPDSSLNEYFQVRRVRIEDNVLIDCRHPILIGLQDGRGSLPPLDTVFRNNRVFAPEATVIEARCDTAGVSWENNFFFGRASGLPPTAGIVWQRPRVPPAPALERGRYGPSWRLE